MKDFSGLEKFQSQQVMQEILEILEKNSISSKKAAKIFRNAEKSIDIGECTKTLSMSNTLMLRYLRKVQRICGEFLADRSNDLPYILCCDWNFSPRVNMASNWTGCVYRVRRRETAPSVAALWLGTKIQRFCGTNQKPELPRPFGTGQLKPCPQGLFSSFLTFLRPNFFSPV